MRSLSVLAELSALAALLCCCAFAGIRPSFALEACAWNASDIVVLTPAASLNHFKVVETIRGDLRPDSALDLPGLTSTAGGSKTLAEIIGSDPFRQFDSDHYFTDPPPARQRDRIVTFLRRPGALPEYNPRPDLPVDTNGWQPAALWGGWLVSAVWIQEGKLYVYSQTMNPGDTHLVEYRESEATLRLRLSGVLALRAKVDQAAAVADPVERSRRLAEMARSEPEPGDRITRRVVLHKLASGGDAEMQALLGLLADVSLWALHQEIIGDFAGKPVPESRLAELLGQEATYWSAECSTLQANWWFETAIPKRDVLRDHYANAISIVAMLKGRKLTEAIPEVRRFAAVWDKCAQMAEHEGKGVLAAELNRLLPEATSQSCH
jgi:hypothetical protein